MERKSFAGEMLFAAIEDKLYPYWKKHSPDRKIGFVGEEIALKPVKDLIGSRKIIEVLGPSGAGKSTFMNELRENYAQDPSVIIRSELTAVNEEGRVENFGELLKMKGLIAKEFGVRHQMLLWDEAKLISTLSGLAELLSVPPPATLIIERGANDVLAMNPFEFPEHYSLRYNQTHNMESLKSIFESITLAEMVDATVLFGTDWETTRSRRVADGKNPEGWLVNSHNWPSIIEGYEWWLGSFWPIWRERQGTGLLIVDGRKPKYRNLDIALSYCEEIIKTG